MNFNDISKTPVGILQRMSYVITPSDLSSTMSSYVANNSSRVYLSSVRADGILGGKLD